MKRCYSREAVQAWRDRVYRRTDKTALRNERQALAFVNAVGFCLASKADGVDLPNLWEAVAGVGEGAGKDSSASSRSYYLSYAWDFRQILPNHNSVFYGKVLKRRPSIIAREYFPYFYALAGRTGTRNEHAQEFQQGRLSAPAKSIMDVLLRNEPMTARELRTALVTRRQKTSTVFDKALEELQRSMFITRVIRDGGQFTPSWSPIVKCFPAEVRKARKISMDAARYKLLEKYFQNQLVTSVDCIRNVFGWQKQHIYHAIGELVHNGIIISRTEHDGNGDTTQYCLVR